MDQRILAPQEASTAHQCFAHIHRNTFGGLLSRPCLTQGRRKMANLSFGLVVAALPQQSHDAQVIEWSATQASMYEYRGCFTCI